MHNKETGDKHLYFMALAIEQAKEALKISEVPVGAVLIDEEGEVLAKGYNKIEALGCQTAHAEVIAIEEACKKRGDWRLDGCKIYITLAPCLMCFGLIQLSRIKAIFYGAKSQLFGVGLDNGVGFPVYKEDLFIQGGIKATESVVLLQDFFKEKRIIKKGKFMKQRLDFVARMKKILLEKRNELGALLFKTSREGVIEKGQVKDSADEALTSTMGKLQSSIEATEIGELKLVEKALARIEKDEYGICIDCGKPISTRRLETYPYAARCISCQERLES